MSKIIDKSAELADCDPHEIAQSRDGGRSSVTDVYPDGSGSDDETSYLMRSPRNAQRLLDAIADLERGGGVERELLD